MVVSGGQQRDWAIHTHVSILPQTPLPSRLPHNIERSSLCDTVGPCWLSILNIAVCTRPYQTPKLSLSPITLLGNHKFVLQSLRVSFCQNRYLIEMYAASHFCLIQFIANQDVIHIYDHIFWCIFPFSKFPKV